MSYLVLAINHNKVTVDSVKLLVKNFNRQLIKIDFLKEFAGQDCQLYQFSCVSPLNGKESQAKLTQLSKIFEFDYFIFKQANVVATPKLVVFDMDSTLIPIEVIDELAAEANCKPQVGEVTETAMRGEIDFKQSLHNRVSFLKGLSLEAFEQVKSKAILNPGVKTFCDYIIQQGGRVAIASGGFIQFAEHLKQTIPFYALAANKLEFEESSAGKVLSGKVVEPIVDAQAKANYLKLWASQLSIAQAECMAVGDGANDLLMLKQAGFGVAYHAKPVVNQQVTMVLKYNEMSLLVDLLKFIQAK